GGGAAGGAPRAARPRPARGARGGDAARGEAVARPAGSAEAAGGVEELLPSHLTSLAFGSLRAPLTRRLRLEPGFETGWRSGHGRRDARGLRPQSRSLPRGRPF